MQPVVHAVGQMLSPLARLSTYVGLALVMALATAATLLSRLQLCERFGLSSLTVAIVLGMALSNSGPSRLTRVGGDGIDFAKTALLRLGVVLYGFRLTLQDVVALGWAGVMVDCFVVATVTGLAVLLGRLLRVERDTALLVGAGSGICGAAAVLAVEPVLKASPAKVSVAVATVMLFGTIAMFLYPLLREPFALSTSAYGFYAGSTIHEVAQVVVAGRAVSDHAANIAVAMKMLRVVLLTPFLFVLSIQQRARSPRSTERPHGVFALLASVPLFAVGFVAAVAINSAELLPRGAVQLLLQLDIALLTIAMAALGLRTQAASLRAAGLRPMLLSLCLAVYLVGMGLALTKAFGPQ